MSSGFVLVLAILVLGGLIATIGDRIGTRVGKARLSLFNLRPRRTAVVVTILTGTLISASTLGVLLAADKQLRTGIFELRLIQNKLSRTRKDLAKVESRKDEIEQQLDATRDELEDTKAQKEKFEKELVKAKAAQLAAQQQLDTLNATKSKIQADLKTTQARLSSVSQHAATLRSAIVQLQTESQELMRQRNQVKGQIAQRDQEIAQRDQEIARRNQVITQRVSQLKELETQQASLERDVQTLQKQFETLRLGNFALFRGQVLSSGVVRIVDPTAAQRAVDQLLAEANRTALNYVQPGVSNQNQQIVRITKGEVDQLVARIKDGRDYLLRVFVTANYLRGEQAIQVVANATLNQMVFSSGDFVAATSIDPSAMSDQQIQERIELLLAASEFRGRGAGILAEGVQVSGDSNTAVLEFIQALKQTKHPVDVQAIAANDIYTAGPLKVNLVALQDGQVLFRTG